MPYSTRDHERESRTTIASGASFMPRARLGCRYRTVFRSGGNGSITTPSAVQRPNHSTFGCLQVAGQDCQEGLDQYGARSIEDRVVFILSRVPRRITRSRDSRRLCASFPRGVTRCTDVALWCTLLDVGTGRIVTQCIVTTTRCTRLSTIPKPQVCFSKMPNSRRIVSNGAEFRPNSFAQVQKARSFERGANCGEGAS